MMDFKEELNAKVKIVDEYMKNSSRRQKGIRALYLKL